MKSFTGECDEWCVVVSQWGEVNEDLGDRVPDEFLPRHVSGCLICLLIAFVLSHCHGRMVSSKLT